MTAQKTFAPFKALIVANNTIESEDLAEFLEQHRFGPVAQVLGADEAAVMIRNAAHAPSVVVFALSMHRSGSSDLLDLVLALRAPLICIDVEPGRDIAEGVVAVRRPYSDIDLQKAIAALSL